MSDYGSGNSVNNNSSDVGDTILVPYLFEQDFKEAKMPINVTDHDHREHLYLQNETDMEKVKFRVFRNFKCSPKPEELSDTELESSSKKCFAWGTFPPGPSVVAVETNQQLALKLSWSIESSSDNSHNIQYVSDRRQRSAKGGLLYQTVPISLTQQESGNFYLNASQSGQLSLSNAPGLAKPGTIRITKNPKSYDIPSDAHIWYELVNYVQVTDPVTAITSTKVVSLIGPFYLRAPTYNMLLVLENTYTLEIDKCPPTYQGSTNPSIKDEIIFGPSGIFGPGQCITLLYKDIQKNEVRLLVNPLNRMSVTINYQTPVEGVDDSEETL